MKFRSTLCIILLLTISVGSIWIGCKSNRVNDHSENPVVVLFENDVHCAVEGYAKLATLKKQLLKSTPYVTVVSCGDFVQGDVIGSISRGEHVVDIMNKVGYDVVVLGNHEFDYGVSQMFKLADLLSANVVCANFRDLRTNTIPFPPYKIIRYGNVEVAYIGFVTSTTSFSVSPKYFLDEEGRSIYDFSQSDFYRQAQACIDAARSEGADYVVALSHLGDDDKGEHASSIDLIRHTIGIDVVIDGHEHHMIADSLVNNQEGAPVLLTSAGTEFENIGMLVLTTEGTCRSRLIPTTEIESDMDVDSFVQKKKEKVLADGRRVVGMAEVDLFSRDKLGNRIVRSQETTIGNLCADAFRMMLQTDVALVNSGGIRANLLQGEITYNHLLAVFPFNNAACIGMMTGQQLMDALEFSVCNLPVEDGRFMQVSGMTFEVDLSVPSPVVMDKDGMFSHVNEAPRRVRELKIFNREKQLYMPVELNRYYTLASFDFLLKNWGDSGILRQATLKESHVGLDVEILASYIKQFLRGRVGSSYTRPEGRIIIK